MNKNDWKSNWYITIINIGQSEFYFDYLIPHEKGPWKEAHITGIAKSKNEAKLYLLISMKECGGWQKSKELEKLYEKYKKKIETLKYL